ncbi:MAG: HNH endonuclease [Candidatus Bathyanammoxibius sp.]
MLGDTVNGSTIGKVNRSTYVWTACPDCDKERWVARRDTVKRCMSCAGINRKLIGERNPRWKGGIRQGKDGYRYITVYPDHPFIEMAGKVFVGGKYRYCIAEHRLVMAQHLGRPLLPWELVHHLEDPKDDNRIENLELLKFKKEHLPSMSVQRLVKSLQSRVTVLEAEVALLQSQLGGT